MTLGLGACSPAPGSDTETPDSVAIRSYPGLPPAAPESGGISVEPLGVGPMVMWVESGSVTARPVLVMITYESWEVVHTLVLD